MECCGHEPLLTLKGSPASVMPREDNLRCTNSALAHRRGSSVSFLMLPLPGDVPFTEDIAPESWTDEELDSLFDKGARW